MAKENLKIEALESEIEALDAKNKALEAQLAAGKTTPSVKAKLEVPTEAFEVDGRKFQFVSPAFNFKGIYYTAKDALKNAELLAELVEIEAGFLREIA